MSLLKLLAVQLGISGTATNNFTASVPASPDGTMKIARGNSGATTQDIITFTSNGAVRIPNQPLAAGTLSAGTGTNFIQSLNGISAQRNMTIDATNKRIVGLTEGWYFVSVSQLVSITNGSYLHVRKNGINIAQAYYPVTATTVNMQVGVSIYLNGTTDYIDFYYQGVITAAWTAEHAPYSIFFLG